MKDVKISYRKDWVKGGTLYNTCVRMDKKVFQSFFKYICDIYTEECNKPNGQRDINILSYIRGDIEEYKGEDTMYLRQTTTRALYEFFQLNNLNLKNKKLILNTRIKIV